MKSKTLLGKRICTAMTWAEMNVEQVCSEMKISRSTLVGWRTGRSTPRFSQLETMAVIFNIRSAWLMTGDGAIIEEKQSGK